MASEVAVLRRVRLVNVRYSTPQYAGWKINKMRTITGAILLFAAQQAFANAYLVGFPYHSNVKDILLPASIVFAVLGIIYLSWGLITESRSNE